MSAIIKEPAAILFEEKASQLGQVYFPKISPDQLEMLSPAESMYRQLVRIINEFENNLPMNLQAAGSLVSFHDKTFLIDNIGYQKPNIIIFYGSYTDGSQVQLVQHITQLNLLLVAAPRKDDASKPRRRIGFVNQAKEVLQD